MNDPAHLQPNDPNQRVVLIAEDEAVVRNIVRIALKGAGYFVLAACDGEEALAISRVFPGAIDLLLTDITMPKMDGLELRQQFLAERPGTGVLLMSGQAPPAEGIDFLPKPFTTQGIVTRVQEFVK